MKTILTILSLMIPLLGIYVNSSAANYNEAIVYLHPMPETGYLQLIQL